MLVGAVCPHCHSPDGLSRDRDGEVACYHCGYVRYPPPLPYIPERSSPSHRGPEAHQGRRQHRVR